MKLLGISGSLRAGSFNTLLLKAAARVAASESAELKVHDISAIPLYNGDLDGDVKPAPVQALLDAIAAADGLVLVTPEYNYSFSGVMKNVIDWASRPAFNAVLTHKPCALLSASMSALGGARAQTHLRSVLAGTLSPVYQAPDYLLASAHTAFNNDGELKSDDHQKRLEQFMQGYLNWLQHPR
ncbi:NADPH-dependent FMN reductase [Oceanimonas marisflavi]|uniref:NADPH-dependent FMN reductase n=1 Tax=Oceanimonas marisflavi TaxID=2059724 RepID=UPI000D2FA318|nr:NADPH-dependent FMN reductase [Oceanimonas marisflavi]